MSIAVAIAKVKVRVIDLELELESEGRGLLRRQCKDYIRDRKKIGVNFDDGNH